MADTDCAEAELKLLEEELQILSVRGEVLDPLGKLSLVSTVFTEKYYNKESFKAHFKKLWKAPGGFEITDIGPNLFVIRFNREEDMNSVSKGSPWLFRGNLVLLKALNNTIARSEVSFDRSLIWIKLLNIPPGCDHNHLIEAVGNSFDGAIDSEVTKSVCKVKINLNLKAALRRCIRIKVECDVHIISFTYDNIPNHCIGCGRLGHALAECNWITKEQQSRPEKEQEYYRNLRSDWGERGIPLINAAGGQRGSVKQRNYIAFDIPPSFQSACNLSKQEGKSRAHERSLPTAMEQDFVPDTISSAGKKTQPENGKPSFDEGVNYATNQGTISGNHGFGNKVHIQSTPKIDAAFDPLFTESNTDDAYNDVVQLDSQLHMQNVADRAFSNITNTMEAQSENSLGPNSTHMEVFHEQSNIGQFTTQEGLDIVKTSTGGRKLKRVARGGQDNNSK